MARMSAPPVTVRTARDVMTHKPDRVAHTDTLNEVARKMRDLMVAFLPVCGEHDELRGVIALKDLQPLVDGGGHKTSATAALLAADPPVSVGVNDPVDHVSHLMAKHRLWLLPVLDGRRLVGVIRYPGRVEPVQRPELGLGAR